MNTVRAGSLVHFDAVARSVGLDPLALLRESGLDAGAIEDCEARIPAIALAAVLEAAAAQSGRPDFGMLMALPWRLFDLGPVSLAVVHQEDLRGALFTLMRHQLRLSDAMSLQIRETDDEVLVTVALSLPPQAQTRQMAEFLTGKLTNLCRALLGADWAPQSAMFRHAAPSDASNHARMFGVTPVFGAEADGLVLRRSDFLLKAPRVLDPAFRKYAEALVECLPSSQPEMISDQAARLIRSRLPGGAANLNTIAQALRLNPRTLQRRLQADGLGFSDLLDRVRRELAETYLMDRSIPVTRVAELLGYGDGSAFTRWFAEQFHTPPSRWREIMAAASADAASMPPGAEVFRERSSAA